MAVLTTQAQAAFERGQMDEAIRLYLRAYNTVDRDPSLLYNVAFIYERSGRVKEAHDLYSQVARAPRASPGLRVKAYERRDRLPRAPAAVPLLESQPAPVTAPPARRAPPAPTPRRSAAPRVKPTARPKAPPSAAPATAEEDAEPPKRRLSPEQRRRLELRRRRARATGG